MLGADFSAKATKLAKKHFANLGGRLECRTIDICADLPEGPQFDVLIDRGCFHCIPGALRPGYLANVGALAKEGARFLLLSRVERTESQSIGELRELFDPYFEVIRARSTAEPLRRSEGPCRASRREASPCGWFGADHLPHTRQ